MFPLMSECMHAGRLVASVAEVVDAGIELLPDFGMAVIPLLDGAERPAEWPQVRRRLRAEGIRAADHRGVLLLLPGELDRFAGVGMLNGNDELYLCSTWDEEFEAFPGRVAADASDFNQGTPLGLEEWMEHTGCVLVLGDGAGLNYATHAGDLAARLGARFTIAKD